MTFFSIVVAKLWNKICMHKSIIFSQCCHNAVVYIACTTDETTALHFL